MTYLQHIPAYVYVLFILLVWLGVSRCFPRSMRVERLGIMPSLIVALAVRAFLQLFPQPGITGLAGAAMGMASGILLGWYHARSWVVKVEPEKRRLTVPGDVLILGIILGAFVFEFVLHFAAATHAVWMDSSFVQPVAAFIWAWLAGMTVGRNANLGMRYWSVATQAEV
jgi:hypothetical protein